MVVWARVPDKNGIIKPTPRPLLITSINPSNKNLPLVAHCISTRNVSDPKNPVIVMPWDDITGGGVGLFKWCAVVLKWSVILDPKDIEEITGAVSEKFLAQVMEGIARSRSIID
jgi:hypothetical protein